VVHATVCFIALYVVVNDIAILPKQVPLSGYVINCRFVLKSFAFCRALKEEKYAARRAILPLLQAEEDER
jgi:uncharacterized membrane protein